LTVRELDFFRAFDVVLWAKNFSADDGEKPSAIGGPRKNGLDSWGGRWLGNFHGAVDAERD